MAWPDLLRLDRAYKAALATLLGERTCDGWWLGELSTSALSTATAVSALALVQKTTGQHGDFDPLIAGGLNWLGNHQNPDGGWGDTAKSFSNISTTMLCRAAFHVTGTAPRYQPVLLGAEGWLGKHYGKTPEVLAAAVRLRYGRDRTFSVPILMTSALAGLVSWDEVPALPFELACVPQSWYRFLRLPVVSYALPALIAIGQAVYHHRRPWNPLTHAMRQAAISRSLRVLQMIQPSSGGFLEAAPLTSFVTLGLASSGQATHPVVAKCVGFLVKSVRPDGSWPIDTNLSTWVTTLAVNALSVSGELHALGGIAAVRGWLLAQQHGERHRYTGADPGGWGWTPLPGSVPDADDTSGALLALRHLWSAGPDGADTSEYRQIAAGITWLLGLQNRDGGWPTFCRGWGRLPFDRSGTDLTAHALRALAAWKDRLPSDREPPRTDAAPLPRPSVAQVERATARGLAYLARQQRPDGAWLPLWFGNQHIPGEENPTYGSARVLAAYGDLQLSETEPARRGVAWLLAAQNPDGGWGAGQAAPSSVEETALAVDVLTNVAASAEEAVGRGLEWLIDRIDSGGLGDPMPIGFYFAKLWYFEKLYPVIFAVAALGRVRRRLGVADAS